MKAVGFLFSPLLKAVGLFKKPKLKTDPVPRPATRDEARAATESRDELLRRRGGAADVVTGSYGAEAPAGGKTTLGS